MGSVFNWSNAIILVLIVLAFAVAVWWAVWAVIRSSRQRRDARTRSVVEETLRDRAP